MKKQQKKQFSSLVKTTEGIWEMVYDPSLKSTAFVGLENGEIKTRSFMVVGGEEIYPFPPGQNLVSSKVVLFPSKVEDFVDEKELLEEIRAFIHKYLEVSEFFEKVTPFYVLLTWIFDSFKELPYLRAIGDYGCGKSRFLKVIGSVCYKPAFTAGATNAAPIFRIIDQFKGTLVIDEADMRFSDTNSEIVKILNNGFQAGIPVLRCASSEKNYEVESYDVFGPKIVATRERYQDKALESRFLVEHMDGKLTRKDIPLNLDDNFEAEALEIRNKCLSWRLQNYGKKQVDVQGNDLAIEPRLNQVTAPLRGVIEDSAVKAELGEFIRKYHKELIMDRGMSFEAPILFAIISLVKEQKDSVTMLSIAERYNLGLIRGEKELSARKIGIIVREKFGLKAERKNVGYVLDLKGYREKIERLCVKYGLESELVNMVNVVGEQGVGDSSFQKELEEMGLVPPSLPNF